MIEVAKLAGGDPGRYAVIVREGRGETRHQVTLADADYRRISGGKTSQENCIEASFRFLLDREPKESIMRSFDLMVIARYFPEFEREVPTYLSRR